MPLFHPKTLLDKTYEIGIIIKGIDGVLELLGAILVLTISPHTINGITRFLTQDALENNPHNIIASHIAKAGHDLASGHNLVVVLFLLSHGLVKVVLVTCLLLNKLWAYPWALVILGIFTLYQMYLLITRPGFGMAFLFVLNVIIIWLIYREWQQVLSKPASGSAKPA